MNNKRKNSLEDNKYISLRSRIIVNTFFIIYTACCILPLLLVISVSLTSESDLASVGYQFFPKSLTFEAYEYVFNGSTRIFSAYGNTIFATVFGTLGSLLLTAGLAYPISRADFRYRHQFTFFVVFTMLFNGGTVPLYMLYTQLIPINNSLLALILPNMIGGFNIILMRSYFSQNIPDSIVEAAEIDGASTLRIFFTMILPLSKPVLATVALFVGMGYWNDYFRCMLFISNDKVMSLQYMLYRIQSIMQEIAANPELAYQTNIVVPSETSRMAMVIVAVGPIIFLYPFLQKYFVKGLTIGAVKG